tara:strand:- start:221 stop:532 length:312 start_codon:yes stop_codon:yes gene_type:complete
MKFIEKIDIETEEKVEVTLSKEMFCMVLAFCKLSLWKDNDDFELRIESAIDHLLGYGMEMQHQAAGFTKDWATNSEWFKEQSKKKTYKLYEQLKKRRTNERRR